MTAGTEAGSPGLPSESRRAWRTVLLILSLISVVVWLVPPLASWARRYEFVEALQFSFFAVVVPVLFVCGAPWRLAHLAAPEPADEDGDGPPVVDLSALPVIDRMAFRRRRHAGAWRSVGMASLYLAGVVVWRIPTTVDALARHPWLAVVEAVTLGIVGAGLWLELVESPPLTPRLSRPHRVALAAVSMWAIWIMAYFVGLSHASWYHAYTHHAGAGISLSADQQLTTGLMWFVSACAFVPVVYWNLIRWLQSEEDPDEELANLVRLERFRGPAVEQGPPAP